jgi:hypothetical protein
LNGFILKVRKKEFQPGNFVLPQLFIDDGDVAASFCKSEESTTMLTQSVSDLYEMLPQKHFTTSLHH